MGSKQIDGVLTTPLQIISHPKGNILHAMKKNDQGYAGFGEVYFSIVNQNEIKAWKKHSLMTLNLTVPQGKVKFVVFDKRSGSPSFMLFNVFEVSQENYFRLTIPPGVWFGFKGLGADLNLILNVANIPHDPEEVERAEIQDIKYDWL
jgi:dTDP-4-dehydrorhamnose 3,5-epimerase